MSFQTVSGTLSADANSSTALTLTLPSGYTYGHFKSNPLVSIVVNGNTYVAPKDFTVSSASNTSIALTPVSGITWAAGSTFVAQLELVGGDTRPDQYADAARPVGTVISPRIYIVSLGSPAAGTAAASISSGSGDNVVASATLAAASTTGATLAISTLDVPRTLNAKWTNTAVLTIRGTDVYGNALTESSASGTSFTGKKAFKTVTKITVSADVTGLMVGYGLLAGLPIFINGSGVVLRESVDGAAPATAGTFAGGIVTASTATSGDVRGTYSPNSAFDGTRAYQLVIAGPDVDFKGVAQFAA